VICDLSDKKTNMSNCCKACLIPEHDTTGEDYVGAVPDSCGYDGCVCHWSKEYKSAYIAGLEGAKIIIPHSEEPKAVDDSNSGDVYDAAHVDGWNAYQRDAEYLIRKEIFEIENWGWECGKCTQEANGLVGEAIPEHSLHCFKRSLASSK
jgi:hypothetical protein